jgi:hypothetical protein
VIDKLLVWLNYSLLDHFMKGTSACPLSVCTLIYTSNWYRTPSAWTRTCCGGGT